MARKKEKLEAGLEDLFSTSVKPEKRARPPRPALSPSNGPAATDAGASAPEQVEAAPPEVEQLEADGPAPEQPIAVGPTAEVKEMATETPQPERPGTRIATGGHEEQLVVFTLANEHYGVDIAAVESIIKLQPITAVPQTPAFVEGLTNLRGTVLPVIDLRKRFELPAEEATKETRIVVAEMDGMQVGMVVDAVSEVLRVAEGAIEPPSPIVARVDPAFITGIAKVDEQGPEPVEGRLIILLDLGQVLSPEEKADLQIPRPLDSPSTGSGRGPSTPRQARDDAGSGRGPSTELRTRLGTTQEQGEALRPLDKLGTTQAQDEALSAAA